MAATVAQDTAAAQGAQAQELAHLMDKTKVSERDAGGEEGDDDDDDDADNARSASDDGASRPGGSRRSFKNESVGGACPCTCCRLAGVSGIASAFGSPVPARNSDVSILTIGTRSVISRRFCPIPSGQSVRETPVSVRTISLMREGRGSERLTLPRSCGSCVTLASGRFAASARSVTRTQRRTHSAGRPACRRRRLPAPSLRVRRRFDSTRTCNIDRRPDHRYLDPCGVR